jgi:hypothetical protein
MSTLYEIVELANGDIALQKEGDAKKATNGAPLVTMRFSTDLLRFLRGAKMDIAKVMIEAGLERVAHLAESATREELESKIEAPVSSSLKPNTLQNALQTNALQTNALQTSAAQSDSLKTGTITSSARAKVLKHRVTGIDKDEQHQTVSHLLH